MLMNLSSPRLVVDLLIYPFPTDVGHKATKHYFMHKFFLKQCTYRHATCASPLGLAHHADQTMQKKRCNNLHRQLSGNSSCWVATIRLCVRVTMTVLCFDSGCAVVVVVVVVVLLLMLLFLFFSPHVCSFFLWMITFGWNHIRKFPKLIKIKSPTKNPFQFSKKLLFCSHQFFRETNQKQQHRRGTYLIIWTLSKGVTEITPLNLFPRLFWRTPFVQKSGSMNCCMLRCNGWTWKLRSMPSSWEQMWSLVCRESS